MFKSTKVNLGVVKATLDQWAYFPYENIKEITSMSSSCGCGDPQNDEKNQQVKARFKPNPVPQHLKIKGIQQYTTTKYLYITYIDNTGVTKLETLEFEATVKD